MLSIFQLPNNYVTAVTMHDITILVFDLDFTVPGSNIRERHRNTHLLQVLPWV